MDVIISASKMGSVTCKIYAHIVHKPIFGMSMSMMEKLAALPMMAEHTWSLKYIEHLETWSSQDFCYQDRNGCSYHGTTAREQVVGRSLDNDLVIDSQTGKDLTAEFDEAQGLHTFDEAHIRQANPRGQGKTNFGAPVVVKDARILRRSFPFTDVSPEMDTITQGLLFLCFQSNIQQRGFEFIHNEWLMSEFMGIRDKLLDPDSGIVEPIDGCYYFVPRVQMFPGDVFFTQ